MSNRKYELRDGSGIGDGYTYDLSGQVTAFQRNGAVNTTTGAVTGGAASSLIYDAAGNRDRKVESGITTEYTPNNLNQYSGVTGVAAPTYDANGNLKTFDGWTYTYDAMNRLTQASKGTVSARFWYDGRNRQVTRHINGNVIFSAWDGWNLVEEYKPGNVLEASYLHGAATDELISMTRGGQTYYFFQDGRGNTSHLANQSGQMLEYYRYGLAGHVDVFAPEGNPRASSAFGNRFLFTGREWYAEIGLYNYRNRFYSPDLGRFLQPDPIGFGGGDANLYRYCGNNPVNRSDPSGLVVSGSPVLIRPNEAQMSREIVTGAPDWTGENSVNGFREVTAMTGGLEHLNQGGGRSGGGGRSTITRSVSRNSSQLGTTPLRPFANSTQGWWTTPEGLPTGSSWVLNLQIQSAIEEGWQASIKSFQSLTFNIWGQIVSHWATIGTTNLVLARAYGSGSFSATVWSAGGQYLANMTGSAQTAVPFIEPIDYSFSFSGTLGGGIPTRSGAHDGYPSYTVWANGEQVYYRHETGGRPELRHPMEIIVGP